MTDIATNLNTIDDSLSDIKTSIVNKGAIYCGFKPEGVEVIEERQVLYPASGYELERISDKEHFSCIWLKDGDVQENYTEVEKEDDSDIVA